MSEEEQRPNRATCNSMIPSSLTGRSLICRHASSCSNTSLLGGRWAEDKEFRSGQIKKEWAQDQTYVGGKVHCSQGGIAVNSCQYGREMERFNVRK